MEENLERKEVLDEKVKNVTFSFIDYRLVYHMDIPRPRKKKKRKCYHFNPKTWKIKEYRPESTNALQNKISHKLTYKTDMRGSSRITFQSVA